jgi:alpha-galactosidase
MKHIRLVMVAFAIFSLPLQGDLLAQKFEGLAQTPPMGWNSWNKFGCEINEDIIRSIADAMVSSGMKDAGYEYINIDDCWQAPERDAGGNIMPHPEKFPSGMKALADYVHSKGLKLGIYSCAGTMTCGGYPGTRGHEFRDARTYASWGIDYLKFDWCHTSTQDAKASYTLMSQAIREAGRPMVFSLCEWGRSKPWTWAEDVGHLWRTTGDIQDCWDCTKSWGGTGWINILDQQTDLHGYAGPGNWNDPDMLEVGNGNMTHEEYKAHFSLWCMLAAPLIAGNDLRDMSAETLEILTNPEAIAVDQDPLGLQGFIAYRNSKMQIWMKKLEGGDLAVCFLNRSEEELPLEINWQTFWGHEGIFGNGLRRFQIDEGYRVRDLWERRDLGTTGDVFRAGLPGHSVIMLRLSR